MNETTPRSMSLRGGRRAGLARRGLRAVAGLYQHHGQRARGSGAGLPDRDAIAGRCSVERHGVPQQLSVVRRRRAKPARLGLRGLAQLSLSGRQRAADELRHGHRAADRNVLDRHVLGQLLSRPALVRPAIALGAPSAAASAAPRRGKAAGWKAAGWSATGARRWKAAGRAAAGTRRWKTAGRVAAGTRQWKAAGRSGIG